MSKLYRESPVVFRIRPDDEISETCIHLEEFMSSAARNSKNALKVIDRMNGSGKTKDTDLLTALKKYVEDTCEAIKKVDSTLKDNNSGLQSLLIEIPNETSEDEVSWRSLVARRDVIAHGLLTVDDDRVYMEAVRDFDLLHQLLKRVYFVPVKTNWATDRGFPIDLKADVWRSLVPTAEGRNPRLGESLIFIAEDRIEGFIAFRIGRTEDDRILMSSSKAPLKIPLSISYLQNEPA